MTHEFDYFYEPMDDTKPIKKLTVKATYEVDEYLHPASPNWAPQYRHSVRVTDMKVFDKMGFDVTADFAFLRPKLEEEFNNVHAEKLLQEYFWG